MGTDRMTSCRHFLISFHTLIAAAAFALFLLAASGNTHAQTSPAKLPAAAEDTAIRPFRVKIPEEELVDLRRRLKATRWTDRETVTDRSQCGAWGAVISDKMASQAPAGLAGIHVNMPATVPPDIARALQCGDPPPAGLSDKEKAAYAQLNDLYTKGSGYAGIMLTRTQTLGYSLSDSPAGLAAFFYDKFADWTFSSGEPEKVLTRDEMLDDITLYWLTNTGTSSARLYWENNANNFNAVDISLPAAITVFPGEIYRTPRSWAERSYHKLIYFHEVDKGGHFAAWEQPELFSAELRAALRLLR